MARLRRHRTLHLLGRGALLVAVVVLAGAVRAQGSTSPADPLAGPATLVRTGEFHRAIDALRRVVARDPSNRAARELLAFAFESVGDLTAERELRAALAAEHPDDAALQADYGRVLERSGEASAALLAYKRARALSGSAPAPELEAAIERTQGQSAIELGAPLTRMRDPDASATRLQLGAALPRGRHSHVAVSAARYLAEPHATTAPVEADVLALTWVRAGPQLAWSAGPHIHALSRGWGSNVAVGAGGVATGRWRPGRAFEAEGRAEYESPWEEAAIAIWRGGRASAVEARLHAHPLARRVHLELGARQRRLSILASEALTGPRAHADQSLWLAGADLWLWNPGVAVRGEMLDEALVAPAPLSSAVRLAYRHYGVNTSASRAFSERIAIAPRAAVDELSCVTTLAAPRGRWGLELRGGVSRDVARRARAWSAGAAAVWAPVPRVRFAATFEEAAETSSGLVGRRRTEGISFHVDL